MVDLQIKQIWDFHRFGDLRERDSAGGGYNLVFEAVREAVTPVSFRRLSVEPKVLLRMLNDPCQSETGRQMARANPQYRLKRLESRTGRSTKPEQSNFPAASGEIILFVGCATGPIPGNSPARAGARR